METPVNLPKIVLLGGPSGAGKTSVAEYLHLNYQHIEHIRQDDYLKDPATFAWQGQYQVWDDPDNLMFDSLVKHLQKLCSGETVSWRTFAKAGEPVYEYVLHPKPIIIVEGNFVLTNAELIKMAKRIFYIDIPLDVSLARRYERGKRWNLDLKEYDQIMMVPSYRRWHHLKNEADVILDGTENVAALAKKIISGLG